tara:strand:- start:809 stop:1609 length:801 start_codon:yes stop_codon:yes gene_type:complete
MLQQAKDLLEEGKELFALLDELDESDWSRRTPFKGWTVNDVVSHLHGGDWLAVQSLTNEAQFDAALNARRAAAEGGGSARDVVSPGPERVSGRDLLAQWWSYLQTMCEELGRADPDRRVRWVGPDMGVRMFTTARQMETWAHGQDIYDLLKRERVYTDRLKNIAVLGCRTFGWTFANRGEEAPRPVPHVRLTAPSGAIWEWHEPSETDRVEGSAVDFCHVVTQGRNIADTSLRVVGESARRWMTVAQCFAGPANDPPAPGEREWRA